MENLPVKFGVTKELVIPEFDVRPSITLDFTKNHEAERRMVEARVVTGATYSDLEMVMVNGESEMRTNFALVSYEIAKSKSYEKKIEICSHVILYSFSSQDI